MKYTKEHEWVNVAGQSGTVGITEHAQSQLGEIVSIELPKVGLIVTKGKEMAMVDSMKASSPVYAPVSGKIIEINSILEEQPQLINQSAQDKGWLVKIALSNPHELNELLDENAYKKLIEESGKTH